MNEIIKKIYDDKLSDGTFEKIVSENFEKMVNDACKDLFTWNGPIKKQMEEKIKGVMSGVLEGTDFSTYVVKLQDVINESLKNTSLEDYKEVAKSVKSICGVNEIEYRQKVSVSEMFKNYVEYLQEEFVESDFDDDEISSEEGTKNAYLECYVNVEDVDDEEEKGYFYKKRDRKVVTLNHDKEDDHPDTVIQFHLEKDYSGNWNVRIDKNFKITDLRYLPNFITYLINLEQRSANIQIDTSDDSTDAEFEFEWDYS